jgi:hypothetical protein
MPIIWEEIWENNEKKKRVKVPETREEALTFLELPRGASESEIEKVFKKLSLKWHPDKNFNSELSKSVFAAISHSRDILLNKNDGVETELFTCYKKGCKKEFAKGFYINNKGIKDLKRRFCSPKHAQDYLDEIERLKNEPCSICGVKHEEGVPEGCERALSAISELVNLDYYYFFRPEDQKRAIKSLKEGPSYYAGEELSVIDGEGFIVGGFLGSVLQKYKGINEKIKNAIDQQRNEWIKKLKGLEGWNLLAEDKQDEFIGLLKMYKVPDQFLDVLKMVEAEIRDVQGDGGDKNLRVEVQEAVQEVEIELNQEPRIFEEELELDWRDYLWNSGNLTQLASRKEEIIVDIQNIRLLKKRGDLVQLREEAILQIRKSLSEDPPVETEELSIPDWEEKIKRASSVGKINLIRSAVLAEISEKRNKDSEEDSLGGLFQQAREPQNWNNPQNLINIIRQIKEFRVSDSYLEKELEVKSMEERLAELDADMYFKSATQSLEKLLKNSGLEGGNMSQEIQQAIDDFKANPTVENQEKAEGLICRDEADRGLIEICQKVETRVKKGNLTEEEKKDLIDEIQRFISKNYYQKTAYSHRKQEVDDLLERLSNLEEQDNNEQSFLEKYFWPIVIVNFSLIVVVFIVWNLSKRKVRNKNY